MDIKAELLKFNDFAGAVYDRQTRLSDILLRYSFSENEIEFLKKEAIGELLDNINFALLCTIFLKPLKEGVTKRFRFATPSLNIPVLCGF